MLKRIQRLAKRGSEGWKTPIRVQRQFPGGSLGAKPTGADDIFSK